MGSREKVVEAAAGIFGKKGYNATSVDDILDKAQVAPSNFYYHFRSKEELAEEVLECYFDGARRQIAPIFMNARLRPAEKLEHLHRLFVQKMSENGCRGGCPMGMLAQELSDTHPGLRHRIAEFFEECVQSIARVVGDGIRAGDFRKDVVPRSAAILIFGSIEGLLLLSKSMKRTEPLEKGFAQALQLLRR